MAKLLAVEPRPQYRLWLKYDDGTAGEVDVSHLVGRGAFRALETAGTFETVSLGPNGEVAWGDVADLCPDSLYLRLTGKTVDEVMPGLSNTTLSA